MLCIFGFPGLVQRDSKAAAEARRSEQAALAQRRAQAEIEQVSPDFVLSFVSVFLNLFHVFCVGRFIADCAGTCGRV